MKSGSMAAFEAARNIEDAVDGQDDCEHENAPDGGGPCPDCGMVFVYCHPCSLAGGAHRAIYHESPACPGPTSGCGCSECSPRELGDLAESAGDIRRGG